MKSLHVWFVLGTAFVGSESRPNCKCTPYHDCWPSAADWSALNSTVSGALVKGLPPASVCYPKQTNYNEEACAVVRSQWFNSDFHASSPVSIDYLIWTNDSCNPIYPNGTSLTGDVNAGKRGCNTDTYPAYVVNATNEEQVATALKWAGDRNIRVNVKATGHSYTGRSVGSFSLSIWTYNIRGLEYLPDFTPTHSTDSSPRSAVRVAAGHNNGEVQNHLSQYNRIIVTGANPSVGIVGWLTGGGHGYLSSTYGMGSDNLLEATIVLPNFTTVLANPWKHPDIFFAIRGGGGGTYGVVTSVVLKTHPSPKTTMHVFSLSSLPNTTKDAFCDTMGFLHAEMQTLKEGGMQGYYYIVGPPIYPTLSFLWTFMLFDKPNGTIESLMTPVYAHLAERPKFFTHTSNITHGPTYFSIAQHFKNEDVATGDSTYGSRLLSPRSLSNPKLTARALARIGPSNNASTPNSPASNPILIGHMIGSSTPPSYHPNTSSLNPAWRDTLVHLVVTSSWADGSPPSLISSVRADITAKTAVLRRLSPETGAYFNEADSEEVEWKESFFGGNYERLVRVKRMMDPRNVLWCRRCVGSEALVEGEGGRLCEVGGVGGEKKSEL